MKCKFCAAPLPKKGLNCSYCNKLNPLNEAIVENINKKSESTHLCVVCNVVLKRLQTSTLLLDYCSNCDGMLIAEEEFEKLIAYKVNPKTSFNPYYLRFIQDHPRDNRKKAQFHNCPICHDIMSVINYKRNSGVLLDICEEHGIWLDGGELRQIIDWYSVGGDKK